MKSKVKNQKSSENYQGKVSYGISVAKSYRNSIFSKLISGGFPFLCSLERDLVGRPTNGDSPGEAVISVQTHHLIECLKARRKDCLQISLKLFNTDI